MTETVTLPLRLAVPREVVGRRDLLLPLFNLVVAVVPLQDGLLCACAARTGSLRRAAAAGGTGAHSSCAA